MGAFLNSKQFYQIRIGNISNTISEAKKLKRSAVGDWKKEAYQAFIERCEEEIIKIKEEQDSKFP